MCYSERGVHRPTFRVRVMRYPQCGVHRPTFRVSAVRYPECRWMSVDAVRNHAVKYGIFWSVLIAGKQPDQMWVPVMELTNKIQHISEA